MTLRAPLCKIAIEPFGVPIMLQTADTQVFSALMARLPEVQHSATVRHPARRYRVEAAEPPQHGLIIQMGARKAVLAASTEVAADLIVNDLQRTLAQRAEGLVFVHAGAVAWEGRALVLPGRSRSGKSELVAALVRAGAEYLSDEFAVFDEGGLVHPYARPIGLRQPDGTRAWTPATSLGGCLVTRPVPPALIAFLRFSPGSRWRPRALSAGQALLGLLRHTVAARRRLPLARSVLVPVASATMAMSGVRGEAVELAERLLRELALARPSVTEA